MGLIGNLLLGWLRNLLPEWFRERREKSRERSRDIYRPIREQFSRALEEIGAGERPQQLNAQFWTDLKHSGRADAIKPELRIQLADIYENLRPRYDACWQAANGSELTAFMGELAQSFGTPRNRLGCRFPQWQKFLTHETFSPSVLDLENPDDVQLWGQDFVDLEKVPSHSLNNFLRETWDRADNMTTFRDVKESRTKLRTAISHAMATLDKNIVN